ncbi:DUF4058 family protein [Phormidesmis sp. 146-12]
MPSPFPGMDPYLEYAAFWSSFHTRFMVAIADAIAPQLGTQYYVEVESRTYQTDDQDDEILIGIPDAIVFAERGEAKSASAIEQETGRVATQIQPEKVSLPMPIELYQRYLEVREMGTDEVITIVELLSPTNKRAKDGRSDYEKKRRLILASQTHLVELDLLRGAKPMAMHGARSDATYRILISRSEQRPIADLYAVMLDQPLPDIPIPLKPGEPEPVLPLQAVFNQLYERARYATRIDYRQPLPPPKLSEAQQQWMDTVLAPLRR